MKKIQKCLLPVAGFGTRFLPFTKAIPKEMLPILTKPLIQIAAEEAFLSGCSFFTMIISKNKIAIKDHFSSNSDIEKLLLASKNGCALDDLNTIINKCRFDYLIQEEMKGLGHAISLGKDSIGEECFGVILPDDLCINNEESVLQQMINIHSQYEDCCIVAVEEVEEENISKYGVIDGALKEGSERIFVVSNLIEKPTKEEAPTKMAIIGRYILTPEIFEILNLIEPDHRGEIQITDALKVLARKGKVIAYKFEGKRYDCGSFEGYLEANKKLSRVDY
jgi:UTP--glucose-1-phosphate uridylyltransferase